MATIKFLLQSKSKSAPIYCRLSIRRGQTYKRKTGLTCEPKKWSVSKGLPIDKDVVTKELKAKLGKLESFILDKFNQDNSTGQTIDGVWLDAIINEFFNRTEPEQNDYLTAYASAFVEGLPFRISDKGHLGVSEGTVKKYKTILRKLEGFEAYKRKRFLIKDVDLPWRQEFIKYLSEVDGLANNTIGRYIKFVKSFVLDAQNNGHTAHHQINAFKGFTVQASKLTLSFEEIEQVKNTSFEDPFLESARDWLIIGCYTGQRVSDLLRMTTGMISEYNDFRFIVITQKKTGKTVQIPLHREVESILLKRNRRFPDRFSQKDESNATIFNLHVKTVCQRAQLNSIISGNLFDNESKRNKAGQFEKWRLVTSHICRRSFASNFYGNPKYPTPLLMNITAHSSEKQFLEYIGKPPLDYSMQLAKIWADEGNDTEPATALKVIKTSAGTYE